MNMENGLLVSPIRFCSLILSLEILFLPNKIIKIKVINLLLGFPGVNKKNQKCFKILLFILSHFEK